MRAATVGLTSGQRLESVIAGFLRAGRVRILCAVTAAIAAIAVTDGYVLGTRASLGLLYILPMMLAATVLPQAQTVALAFVCSVLRGLFDTPSPPLEILLRFLLGLVAYAGSGLIVTALIRHRALVMEHLGRMRQEQESAAPVGRTVEGAGGEQSGGDSDHGRRRRGVGLQSGRRQTAAR